MTAIDTQKKDNAPAERVEQRPTATPAVDIYENRDQIVLLADLPGVSPANLTVHFERGELLLRGSREASGDRPAFDYVRSFVLPKGIDGEAIAAELDAGVLKVTLSKPPQKSRQIPVRAKV